MRIEFDSIDFAAEASIALAADELQVPTLSVGHRMTAIAPLSVFLRRTALDSE